VIFKLSLPSVKKLSASVKNKTLGKKILRWVFSFTEGFLCGTRQRASLPSARKKHSAKYLVLSKEPNYGSACLSEQKLQLFGSYYNFCPYGPHVAPRCEGPKQNRFISDREVFFSPKRP
jgi:hypothetical protein